MGGDQVAERLLTALGRPADLAAHELAALTSESRGLLGELGLTTLHAWQRVAESQGRGRGVRDVAVLFTDLVGFSDWALEAGDDAAIKLLAEVGEAIEPPILERGGEVVKRLGDGLMAAFGDAQGATEAAFDAHERVAAIEREGFLPQLKTGIHLGRPRKIADDYLGVDVNIAARLLEAAKPGEILISDRTLRALDAATVTARKRRFSATGVPSELTAHVVERLGSASVQLPLRVQLRG
jgi:adenylate cyclase